MSTLKTASVLGSAANNWVIDVNSPSYLYQAGMILQTVHIRTETQSSFSSATTGNGTTITPLNITITPKRADSILLCTWMINYEVHWDNVFVIHRNGSIITNSGFQSFNNVVGNLRYSGVTAAFHDNDNNSTQANQFIQYVVPAVSTASATYAPAIRSSSTAAHTLFLNRTIGSGGQDVFEISVSTGMIQEIAQ